MPNEMLLTEAIYYAELGSPTKGKMAVEKTVIQARADALARVVSMLSECFKLAPVDDAYLRILVKDVLETLKTGKTRKQRADENMTLSNQSKGGRSEPNIHSVQGAV